MEIKIRKFKDSDAETIATLVQRNFREVNIHDYSIEEMEKLTKEFNSNKIRKTASYANTYVAVDKSDTIVGTGSISSFFGSMTESILLTIFVVELRFQPLKRLVHFMRRWDISIKTG